MMGHRIIKLNLVRLCTALLLLINFAATAHGQKYYSKTGTIHFLSMAPLEKIEATNKSAYVVYDASSGQMEWSVLIKGFNFEKALMQQHFNENYMDSDKYPKANFKGKLSNPSTVNFSKDGTYNVEVSGDITIHGVTKPLRAPGKITIRGGKINASSSFDLTIADFKISIPKVVRDNIAKTVSVTVNADLAPLK